MWLIRRIQGLFQVCPNHSRGWDLLNILDPGMYHSVPVSVKDLLFQVLEVWSAAVNPFGVCLSCRATSPKVYPSEGSHIQYPIEREYKDLAILPQFETTLKGHCSSRVSHGLGEAIGGLHHSSAFPSAHSRCHPFRSKGVCAKATP